LITPGASYPGGGAVVSGTKLFIAIQPNILGVWSTANGTAINANLISGLNWMTGLAISGNTLYVASLVGADDGFPAAGKIGIYNASTGAAINAKFITGLSNPEDIVISGNALFVSNASAGTIGKYNAATGAAINSSFITGLDDPNTLGLSGSNLYVLSGDTIGEYNATTGAAINRTLITGLQIGGNSSPVHFVVRPEPVPGLYTLLIGGTDSSSTVPLGTGYATMTVLANGGVTMGGKLADGQSFTASGILQTGTGPSQFLVNTTLSYPSVTPNRAKGSLTGALTFVSLPGTSDLSGTLNWTKPQQTKGDYRAAINTNLSVIGSYYTPPAKGGSALPGFTTGTLEMSDTAALISTGTTPLNQPVTLVSGSNVLELTAPIQDKLKVKINPANGEFSGSFNYPVKPVKSANFYGVLFQDQGIGGGYFLGPFGSGSATLTP
jgi:hypothetical protein